MRTFLGLSFLIVATSVGAVQLEPGEDLRAICLEVLIPEEAHLATLHKAAKREREILDSPDAPFLLRDKGFLLRYGRSLGGPSAESLEAVFLDCKEIMAHPPRTLPLVRLAALITVVRDLPRLIADYDARTANLRLDIQDAKAAHPEPLASIETTHALWEALKSYASLERDSINASRESQQRYITQELEKLQRQQPEKRE